jgi:hypothetical protein
VTDVYAAAHEELGVDPQDAVGAVQLGVDLIDQVGQHRVSERAFGRRTLAMLVEPRL